MLEEPKITRLEAQEIPLNIIYEDNDIVVIKQRKRYGSTSRKWEFRWHIS